MPSTSDANRGTPHESTEEHMMPLYDLRLFKSGSSSPVHKLVDRILFEANDDEQAVATAPFLDASLYDDSELGLLFNAEQNRLWILKP